MKKMDGCFLRKVRETCRAVAERATSVHIHCDRIPSYAMSLPVGHFKRTKPDPASHFFGHPNDTAAFFLTLDTINFGSGYFPHLRKRTGMSGYYTVAQSLKNYYVEHGAISARELSRLTPDHCALMLKQDLDRPPVRELMALFSTALRDLGRYLIELFAFVDPPAPQNHVFLRRFAIDGPDRTSYHSIEDRNLCR